jgi:26S proteasome regulatory subunit N9
LRKQIEGNKDVEQYLYSSYYKLAMLYYKKKQKWRLFFTNALQHLAYTNEEEMNDREKIELSYEMALAAVVSKDIYNFSELLEQPLMKSLEASEYAWIYRLIQLFNQGDIRKYNAFRSETKEVTLAVNSETLPGQPG